MNIRTVSKAIFRIKKVSSVSIIIGAILISTPLYASEVKPQNAQEITEIATITLKGKIDARLYARLESYFIPSDYSDEQECLSKETKWTTGTRKSRMSATSVELIPDKDGRYEVTVPISYVGESPCAYKFRSTFLLIRRDKDDDLYTRFTVASTDRLAFNVYKGHSSGYASIPGVSPPVNTKKFFQMSSGTRISCFTTYLKRDNPDNNRVTFTCVPEYQKNVNNGVDELTTTIVDLNIRIDDDRCRFIPTMKDIDIGKKGGKDYFRDYAEPLSAYERFKQWLRGYSN